MTPIPERIIEEAYRLAKEAIFHGGVDWAVGDIAKALAAAEQRGREMEREELATFVTDHYVRNFDNWWRDDLADQIRSRSEGKGE